MVAWLTTELAKIRILVLAGLDVGAVISVVMVYIVTKALTKTIGALFLAGLVVWGAANVQWFSTKVSNDTGAAMVFVPRALPSSSGLTVRPGVLLEPAAPRGSTA